MTQHSLRTVTGAGTATPPGEPAGLALLAFNRLGFGPRPGDLAAFAALPGATDEDRLAAYLDQQLAPEAIDDTACEGYLAGLSRADTQDPPTTIPPLDATVAEITAYAGERFVNGDLQRFLWTAAYARGALSRRQLVEVVADFWSNHLNTTFQSQYRYWEDHYVIRRYVLGNFRDLLGASAKSPSMLRFLSNDVSDGNNPNENYARELMELHTTGSYSWAPGPGYRVQPNYTEQDVHTAARILSGWTTARSPDGSFRFNGSRNWPVHHWPEKRVWLGNDAHYHIPYGGVEQGERLLDILADHPSTAYFLSTKLCRRFISDTPETFCPGAIEAGAQAFLATHGDIRAMVRAIVLHHDPAGGDFAHSWGQKVKTPLEFYLSALRALASPGVKHLGPDDWSSDLSAGAYRSQIQMLGQVLYDFSAPTGYPDDRRAWWNTNQVFGRWTLANMLVNDAFGSQTTYPSATTPNPALPPANARLDAYIGRSGGAAPGAAAVVDRLIRTILGRGIDQADVVNLTDYLGAGEPSLPIASDNLRIRPLIAALLASPYFMWR
jgi:uncharacterized protein (DUF1800 family)